MLLLSGVVAADSFTAMDDHLAWRVPLDLGLGLAAFAAVHLRRRWPLPVALVTLALSAVSACAAGPALLAIVSVSTRRRSRELAAVAVGNVVAAVAFWELVPRSSTEPFWVDVTFTVVLTVGVIGWGMYIGSRRELMWTLRQRAERAEAERDLRIGKARADERARIAREMHDVLAHRISQVSMHAGALAYRTDLDADALRAGIAEVQTTANEALNDLRGVLGVLRDPGTGDVAHAPQPTYQDVPALVADAQRAGAHVALVDHLAEAPAPAVGRTLYRIVQEGITNARKHAPGARLTVDVRGDAATGIDVTIRNPLGLGPPAAPGAGLGLVGLVERVELAGGRCSHGVRDGSFVLEAWLPWRS